MRTVAVASSTTNGSSGSGEELVIALANSTDTRSESRFCAEAGDVQIRTMVATKAART